MEVNDRIKQFMEIRGLSSAEVSEKSEIQTSTFSHFLNGRNKPSLEVITKIHQAYPELNLHWILYESGEMFVSTPDSLPENSSLFGSNASNTPFTQQASALGGQTGMNSILTQSLPATAVAGAAVAQMQVTPEKPPRKITEIRVFFDDNTYETFRNP